MKNRIISCALLLAFVVLALSSCGGKNTFETFFVSVKKFDTGKMESCISQDSSDYFETVKGYINGLSEEQTEIVKTLYSYVGYAYKTEAASDASSFDITLTYVDFYAIMNTVDENRAVGIGTASDYISEIINGGGLSSKYVKKADVTVYIAQDGKINLGNSTENKMLTYYLGFDVFLRWYSNQR